MLISGTVGASGTIDCHGRKFINSFPDKTLAPALPQPAKLSQLLPGELFLCFLTSYRAPAPGMKLRSDRDLSGINESFKFSCSQSPGRVSAGPATAPAREILFSQSCSSSRPAQSWALESVFIVISGFGGKNTTLITSKSGYFWFCFLIFVCVCFWFFGFSFWGGVGGFLLLCFWVGFFCGFVFVFHSKDKLSYRTFFM